MSALGRLLTNDAIRWRALGLVMSLRLPDCWIGAGFIRNAVWDHLHLRPSTPAAADVDVLWFDPGRADPASDKKLEATLRSLDPTLNWSVKNQARMHIRNSDAPYSSAVEAMRHWPETATAVAARRTGQTDYEIAAPSGLDDLFALVVRPTPCFMGVRRDAYLDRVRAKDWSATWPRLCIEAAGRN